MMHQHGIVPARNDPCSQDVYQLFLSGTLAVAYNTIGIHAALSKISKRLHVYYDRAQLATSL
eukprot:4579404-Amphidinium_carterae.1